MLDNTEHEAYIREHEDTQIDEDYEMELKASDRKKLWAKAGGRCTLCNCNLFLEDSTNIGKECHISSHKPDHPSKDFSRYDPNLTDDERDRSYENAILLCGNCHDIIDNPENTQYTIEALHKIKEKHEANVKGVDKLNQTEYTVNIEGITNKVFDSMTPISKTPDGYRGWVGIFVKVEGETVGKCTGSIITDKGEEPIYDWISYREAVSLHRKPLDGADSFRIFDLKKGMNYLYTHIKSASNDSVTIIIELGKKKWKREFSLTDITEQELRVIDLLTGISD